MDLIHYAPEDYKEHLVVLKNTKIFNRARRKCELKVTKFRQHYVLTGNEGVGKAEAAHELYMRLSDATGIAQFRTYDAVSMFDLSDGFETSIPKACENNTLIYIKNAERLNAHGNSSTKTGIESLCNSIPEYDNFVVILGGKRSRLMEMVKGHEKARELFSHIFHFEDLLPEALFDYITDYALQNNYAFDPSAEDALRKYLNFVYKLRGSNFRNTYFLQEILEKEIIPKMSERTMRLDLPPEQLDLCSIFPQDLPEVKIPSTEEAIKKMEDLVGLDEVKKQILDHTALVKLNNLRASKGLYNKMPPMHMVFTGNPGTGKTTIAQCIGEIYHSIGALSSGHVVETDRSKLVGEFIGVTEKNTREAINSANGGVLFIDEAYNLFTGTDNSRDFGNRVIETLLTSLSVDDIDMIVILAGYTNEMTRMLEANPGMKSRFPYIFNFEDYTPVQLMQIGKIVLEREQYKMTPEAERKLAKYIIHAYDHKDEHFGNGRFVTRLITSHIIPSLSRRLLTKSAEEITMEEMTTIEACDIPDIVTHAYQPKDLDETILAEAFERLDQLTALSNAKQALHDYVAISRLRHQQGILKVTPQSLCWDFIGKTGTGKSTVAEILGKLLQGLGILKRGQTISVNADELMGKDSYQVMERVIKEAKDGLLFLDMDAPTAGNCNISYLRMWIQNKLREYQQTTALVFAQVQATEDMIARNLATNGIAAYGNSIVFNDFSISELSEILSYLLKTEYQLEMTPDAKEKLAGYVQRVKASETKDSPVNARTILHLAQTIAHVTQLRVAKSGGERLVTLQDVSHFKWDNKGKVGFI